MQAAWAIKLFSGLGVTVNGRLQVLDVYTMTWESFVFEKIPACLVCGSKFAICQIDESYFHVDPLR